eukprot:scaffold295916_cov18-Prasinocladus_malaysianus.AAC.1
MSAVSPHLRPPNPSASNPLEGTGLRTNPGKCMWLAPLSSRGTAPYSTPPRLFHPHLLLHRAYPVPAGPVPVPYSTYVTLLPVSTRYRCKTYPQLVPYPYSWSLALD